MFLKKSETLNISKKNQKTLNISKIKDINCVSSKSV